ncbi:hypothetical protein A7J50_2321 [Pseudomonas antarctica]|uniref:Uncharacterized protein n=1 Tax=Pseudomonas antarctica TaxID=219572 RepID=A0A172Z075_9PSED|nr:hypothetical protein [Pseudomonas antarctica]ANF85728.1 hypothetical protein A7J50_2321 [Pseudomonas antarctica]
MDFLIGVIVTCLVIFGVSVYSKTDKLNKLTRLCFTDWMTQYHYAETHIKHGMSRALILQTFHLAVDLHALTPQERVELDAGWMKEDPKEILNQWFEHALPIVKQEIGAHEIEKSEARMIGVFMLVAMKSFTIGEPLRDYLRKFS